MKKIFSILIAITLIAGQQVKAQEAGSNLVSLQYSMGFSMGDLNKYIENASFLGILLDYRFMATDNVYAGVELGGNLFYEKKDYATYTKETITLTGTQWRYVSTMPLLANVGYVFSPASDFSPYAGIGIGTLYHEVELDIGIYEFTQNQWQFAVKPEVGMIYKPMPEIGILLGVKSYNGFKTDNSSAINFMALNIGIVWIE
jgi:opacity protein-like surface antigen